MRAPRLLTALPVYNEADTVDEVLAEVARHADDVLVVDDGSTDGTAEKLLRRQRDDARLRVETHRPNRGYGAALRTAFCYARRHRYDVLVTIDCDGQHEPQRIRQLASLCDADGPGADIVSGSRYLPDSSVEGLVAPVERRQINHTITAEINDRLGLDLTDAFCGFKAYRVGALQPLRLRENGYAMPLELWVQAARHGLRVVESAVPRIYLDEERSFGGELDDGERRLRHYREVIDRALRFAERDAVDASAATDPCPEWLRSVAAATT